MDINTLREIITVLSFAAFLGIIAWAWSGRQKSRFAEAAQLPFDEDDAPPGTGPTGARKGEGQ
jgi:cytochrome c oxidase cbb3-type subunit 4